MMHLNSKTLAVCIVCFVILALPKIGLCVKWADPKSFGAVGDGTTDDTAAFSAAAASLGSNGGIVYVKGVYLIASQFAIPNNVFLLGDELNPGEMANNDYRAINYASYLIVDPSVTITLNSNCGVKNCVIVSRSIYSDINSVNYGSGIVGLFNGVLFTPNRTTGVSDTALENLLILGFDYIYDGTNGTGGARTDPLIRPIFRNIRGDCTNGIFVTNVTDIGRAENCHMWPFLTARLGDAYSLRSGIAFYTGSNSSWMKWDDCFEFGYSIGHLVDGSSTVRQINCGVDGPVDISQSLIGFKYQNQIADAKNINPVAGAQGNTGILINTTALNSLNDIKIVGGTFQGNNSSNGYIDVQSGTYSIIGCTFWDNSEVGHIKLGSGAGYGVVTGCTFGNSGSNQPIFGDATAISKCTLSEALYSGSYTKQSPLNWTPTLTFGGSSAGITYTSNIGAYAVKDHLVTATFQIIVSNKGTATGAARISGLPLASNSGYFGGAVSPYARDFTGLTGTIIAAVNGNESVIELFQPSSTGIIQLTNSNFTNGSVLAGMIQYFIQ